MSPETVAHLPHQDRHLTLSGQMTQARVSPITRPQVLASPQHIDIDLSVNSAQSSDKVSTAWGCQSDGVLWRPATGVLP